MQVPLSADLRAVGRRRSSRRRRGVRDRPRGRQGDDRGAEAGRRRAARRARGERPAASHVAERLARRSRDVSSRAGAAATTSSSSSRTAAASGSAPTASAPRAARASSPRPSLVASSSPASRRSALGAGAALSASCDLDGLTARRDRRRTRSSTPPTARCSARSPPSATASRCRIGSMTPVAAEGDGRDRGPALLPARRRRLRRHRSRALWTDVSAGQGRRGRLDDHPAARAATSTPAARRRSTRKIKEACLAIKLSDKLVEARDPRRVPEHRLLRQPRLRRRGRGADVLLAAARASSRCAQAALLAGLPQAPSIYDPFHNPQAALARRAEVLRAMLDDGRRSRRAQYRVGDPLAAARS